MQNLTQSRQVPNLAVYEGPIKQARSSNRFHQNIVPTSKQPSLDDGLTSNSLKRISQLPQRSMSTIQNEAAGLHAPGAMGPPRTIPSPSKLPPSGLGLHRSQSVKQVGTRPPRPTPGHQPQHSLGQTESLLRPQHLVTTEGAPGREQALQNPVTRKSSVQAEGVLQSNLRTRPPQPRRVDGAQVTRSSSENPSNLETSKVAPWAGNGPRTPANAAVKMQRPLFTAMQQQFLPWKIEAKPAEPPLARFANLSSPVGQHVRELHDLKLELLHLHMMHRGAAQVMAQWKQSAKDYYGKHFQKLVGSDEDLNAQEIDLLTQRNVRALLAYSRDTVDSTFEHRIKILTAILGDTWTMCQSAGRYASMIHAFEHWHDSISMIQDRRHRSLSSSLAQLDMIEGLGDGWKAEAATLTSKILQMAEDLQALGSAEGKSDLNRCILVLSSMFNNMLEELDLILHIEAQLVQDEQAWAQASIDHLTANVSGTHAFRHNISYKPSNRQQ